MQETIIQSRNKTFMFGVCLLAVCLFGIQLVKLPEKRTISKFIGHKHMFTFDNGSRYDSQRQVKSKSTKRLKSDLHRQYQGGNVTVISKCQMIAFPVERFRAEAWQNVGPTNSSSVLSAYHDQYAAEMIQLIGLIVQDPPKHFCQLWYKRDGSKSVSMNISHAAIDRINYMSCRIICLLPDSRVPFAVSVVTEAEGCAQANNLLEIKTIRKRQNYTRQFTVCLSPLHRLYGRAFELVQWIELNRILGADHFIVYNLSSATNIGSVLEYYRQLGVVDVVQWSLPTNISEKVHYYGQICALNDCLLRSKSESEYIVNVDVDEFLIPHGNCTTWLDIIDRLPPLGQYHFRTSFFPYKELNTPFEDPDKRKAEKFRLSTLLLEERKDEIWRPRERSKYFARTSAVEAMNIHSVKKLFPGHTSSAVPVEIGFLHHYKIWTKSPDIKNVLDKTLIDKYGKVLLNRVANTWSMLKNVQLELPINAKVDFFR